MKLLKPSSISERPMLQSSRSVNTYDPPPITPRSIAGSRRKNFKNGTTSVSLGRFRSRRVRTAREVLLSR